MYDFMTGDLPEGERAPYKLIRWWLLDCYYTYCRSHLQAKNVGKRDTGWVSDEYEIGYAYEQCEQSYFLPIEQLMLEVLALILRAGRGSETANQYHLAKIAAILEKQDLSKMLKSLEGEELSEFESDLKLLELM